MSHWRRYPKYKDSGVEWLGAVPSQWDVIKLKYLFANFDFKRIPLSSEERSDRSKEYPYYGASGIIDMIDGYIFDEPLILVAEDGANLLSRSTPLAFIAEGKYWVNNHAHILKPKSGPLIFWEGVLQMFDYTPLITGAAQPKLTADNLGTIFLPKPPFEEQTKISTFLNHETVRIDTLVVKKEQQLELLRKKREALISHVVTKGLDPDAKMKDSGIPSFGKMPEQWDCARNKWLYNEINEKSTNGDEELLTVSHITGVTPRSEKDVNMFLPLSFEGYKLCKKDDLVINTMWAFMGALGISPCDGMVSPSYNIYRFKRQYHPPYFDYLYRTPVFICEILRHSKGVWTSRLRLYPDEFLSIFTIVPPFEEQKKIVEYVESRTKIEQIQIDKIQESLNLLNEYRSALISAAVTGKIDVRAEAR